MEVVIYGIVFILLLAIIAIGYKKKKLRNATKIVIYLIVVVTIVSLLLKTGLYHMFQAMRIEKY